MEALIQFQQLAIQHYDTLKNYPEFQEAHHIYLELQEVQKRLSELEHERIQHHLIKGLQIDV